MKSLIHRTATFLLTALIFAMSIGCGSSSNLTGAEKKWSHETGYDDVQTAKVDKENEAVFLSVEKDLVLLNEKEGSVLKQEPESRGIGSRLKEAAKEAASEIKQATQIFSEADRYSFAFLEDSGTMALLDYTSDSDIIRLFDFQTGDELWKNEGHQWSMARYQNIAGEVSKQIFKNIGMEAGAVAGVAGAELTRERYAQDLITEIPGQNSFLFRTTDGLHMMDIDTGETIWQLEDFEASGINEVYYLEDRDEILLITSVSRVFDRLQDHRKVMVVDASDGSEEWTQKYEHATRYIEGTELRDDKLLIHYTGSQSEVFDLDSGDIIIEPKSGPSQIIQRLMQAGVEDSTFNQPKPQIFDSKLYTIHTEPSGARPENKIISHDLNTGEQLWETEFLDNSVFISTINNSDEHLIVTPSDGDYSAAAINKEDGSIDWNADGLDTGVLASVIDKTVFASDGKKLQAIDAQSGEVNEEIDLDDLDLGQMLYLDNHEDHIYIVGRKAVAVFDTDLSTVNNWEPKGRIEHQQVKNDHLVVLTEPVLGSKTTLRVMDLSSGEELSSIEVEPHSGSWFGNLTNGMYIGDEGDTIYLLDEELTISKYQISPN